MRNAFAIAIIVALIAALVVPAGEVAAAASVASSPFSDVSRDHPYRDEFALLFVLGVFEGYGDGTVGPDDALTRAQFAKVAISVREGSYLVPSLSDFQPHYKDAGSMAPVWWGWVNAAEYLGLVRGFDDGSFRPDSPLTFAEATAVLLRVAGYGPYLENTSYPRGYIDRARQLGLTGGLTMASDVPITRAEMARMVVNAMSIHPPKDDGTPADGHTGGYRPSLLENRRDRVEGTVDSLGENSMRVDGVDYEMASRVFLTGVSSIDELSGSRIVAYRGRGDRIQYVQASRGSYTLRGVLMDASIAGRSINVGENRLAISPPDTTRNPTTWSINGATRTPSQTLLDEMVESSDVQAIVGAFNGSAEQVELLHWDIGPVIITDEPAQVDGIWTVEVTAMVDGQASSHRMSLPDTLGGLMSGEGAPESPEELSPGDNLMIASRGAQGFGDEEISAPGVVHRILWGRNEISGDVESVEVGEENGYLLLVFHLEDGDSIKLRENRYLGGLSDMSLNELRHASWVSFAVDDDGYALWGLDALVTGAGARYVRLLAMGELAGGYYIVVEQAGLGVTYQLSFPALWVQFSDDDLNFREGYFAELNVNASGKVEGIRSWISPDPSPISYMVVSIDTEEELVTLRQLDSLINNSGDLGGTISVSLLEAYEPVVYSRDWTYAGIEALSPGRRVQVHFSDRGEPALIRPD